MKKKNVLKHRATIEGLPNIVPVKNVAPDWFKKTNKISPNGDKNVLPYNLTFKACSAFTDAILSGYIIPLPMDIAVKQTDAGPSISWSNPDIKLLDVRSKSDNYMLPTPHGYADTHFVWRTTNQYRIPKGYSALMTHPLNRFDLPFLTLSGIVDGPFDVYEGNLPVFFNNTFEGIIEAGTPISQVILFKTENWDSEIDHSLEDGCKINHFKSTNKAIGWYKQNIWNKKIYN